MKQLRSTINYQVSSAKVKLDRAKQENARIDDLTTSLTKMKEVRQRSSDYLLGLRTINAVVRDEKADYEQERVGFIEEITTASVERIFPNRGYKIKLHTDSKKRKEAFLKIITKQGRVLSLDLGVGMLLQYLISFSSTSAILESFNSKTLLIDEAFSVSSKENKEEIKWILDEQAQDGFLIILVSQDEKLYTDIPHRDFRLGTNISDNTVTVAEVFDVWRE